jgi:hypothetical protein
MLVPTRATTQCHNQDQNTNSSFKTHTRTWADGWATARHWILLLEYCSSAYVPSTIWHMSAPLGQTYLTEASTGYNFYFAPNVRKKAKKLKWDGEDEYWYIKAGSKPRRRPPTLPQTRTRAHTHARARTHTHARACKPTHERDSMRTIQGETC